MAILIQACYFVGFSNFVRLRASSVRFLYRSHASCATKVLKSLNPIFFMNENQFVCIGVQQLLSVLHLTCCSFESHKTLLGVKKTLREWIPLLYCTVQYYTVLSWITLYCLYNAIVMYLNILYFLNLINLLNIFYILKSNYFTKYTLRI